MQSTSLFDKGFIQVRSLGTVAPGATTADTVFPLVGAQRYIAMIVGSGPDPVGNIEFTVKSKAGAAAAVALDDGRPRYTASSAGAGVQFDKHNQQKMPTGGKFVIPGTVTTGDATAKAWNWALLLDVPVLPDNVDQLAFAVKNAGTTGTALFLVFIGEHTRH